MRTLSGWANRCGRSPDNPARRGDSDRRAGRRAARTSAMKREIHAAAEWSKRPQDTLLGKRSRAGLSVHYDRRSDVLQISASKGLLGYRRLEPYIERLPCPCLRIHPGYGAAVILFSLSSSW